MGPACLVRTPITLKYFPPNIFSRRLVFEGFDRSKVTPRRRIDEILKI